MTRLVGGLYGLQVARQTANRRRSAWPLHCPLT